MVLEISEDEFAERMEYEYEHGLRSSIWIKHIANGANTLKEVAEKLRDYANELEGMIEEGWELEDGLDDSVGEIVRKGREIIEV